MSNREKLSKESEADDRPDYFHIATEDNRYIRSHEVGPWEYQEDAWESMLWNYRYGGR